MQHNRLAGMLGILPVGLLDHIQPGAHHNATTLNAIRNILANTACLALRRWIIAKSSKKKKRRPFSVPSLNSRSSPSSRSSAFVVLR